MHVHGTRFRVPCGGYEPGVHPLRSRAMIAASLVASTAAIRRWAESGGEEDLTDLMSQAFDALRLEFAIE